MFIVQIFVFLDLAPAKRLRRVITRLEDSNFILQLSSVQNEEFMEI